jgi:hypothetical protein
MSVGNASVPKRFTGAALRINAAMQEEYAAAPLTEPLLGALARGLYKADIELSFSRSFKAVESRGAISQIEKINKTVVSLASAFAKAGIHANKRLGLLRSDSGLSVVEWLSKANEISKLINEVKEYAVTDNKAVEENTVTEVLPELFGSLYPSIRSWDSDREGGPLPYFVYLGLKELGIEEKSISAIKGAIYRNKKSVTSSSK